MISRLLRRAVHGVPHVLAPFVWSPAPARVNAPRAGAMCSAPGDAEASGPEPAVRPHSAASGPGPDSIGDR